MGWHYQVVRSIASDGEEDFAIHEAYPDIRKGDEPLPITAHAITPHGSSVKDLRWTLEAMLADLDLYETVEWSDYPPVPTTTDRAKILATATDYITRDRAAAHGGAEATFGRIADLWSADLGIAISEADVARLMVLLKVARAKGNPSHTDNWIDMAGYAALGGELSTPRLNRQDEPAD